MLFHKSRVVPGVIMRKGIKPRDAEEAVGCATHGALCHYFVTVKSDAWRSLQLRHAEEIQQKWRDIANKPLEGNEDNC